MEQVLRQTWAFFFRDYHLTRRYFSWVVVFTFYAVVNSAPLSRPIHLAGVSLFATAYAVVRAVIIVAGLLDFVDLDLSRANWAGMVVVLAVSSAAFIGL